MFSRLSGNKGVPDFIGVLGESACTTGSGNKFWKGKQTANVWQLMDVRILEKIWKVSSKALSCTAELPRNARLRVLRLLLL